MSIERASVATIEHQPVARSNRTRRNPLKLALLSGVAGAVLLTACSSKTSGEGTAAAAPATTTSSEPVATTTATEPTTTSTTTTSETSSTTTEIVTLPTLCAMGEQLGIAAVVPGATCTEVTSDDYFTTVVEGARWQSGANVVDTKIIEDIDGAQFQYPAGYNATNVQFEQRGRYGLEEHNTLCSEDACYALQAGQDTVFEVAGGSQEQNLAVLGRLVDVDVK